MVPMVGSVPPASNEPKPEVAVRSARIEYVPTLVDDKKEKSFFDGAMGQIFVGVAVGVILSSLSK